MDGILGSQLHKRTHPSEIIPSNSDGRFHADVPFSVHSLSYHNFVPSIVSVFTAVERIDTVPDANRIIPLIAPVVVGDSAPWRARSGNGDVSQQLFAETISSDSDKLSQTIRIDFKSSECSNGENKFRSAACGR